MISDANRSRPGDELSFQVLRTLMTGYLFWGSRAGIKVSELCTIVATSEERLRPVLYHLFRDGWMARDEDADTVWLTSQGARNFLASPESAAVEFPVSKWQ
ncbi:MAG: hypothetical protein HY270_15885 [Deltaproteobacteria bacterium]|nr:hypothetical protein [Deltaproteobacteria bacterium]